MKRPVCLVPGKRAKKTLLVLGSVSLAIAVVSGVAFPGLYFLSRSSVGVSHEDLRFMETAYEEAEKALAHDDFPVGALVVVDGLIVARGHNEVKKNGDYRDHAEMVAINSALRKLDIHNFYATALPATLYTTYEPCPMCEGFLVWTGVDRVVVGKRKSFGKLARKNIYRHLKYRWKERGGINEGKHDRLRARYESSGE